MKILLIIWRIVAFLISLFFIFVVVVSRKSDAYSDYVYSPLTTGLMTAAIVALAIAFNPLIWLICRRMLSGPKVVSLLSLLAVGLLVGASFTPNGTYLIGDNLDELGQPDLSKKLIHIAAKEGDPNALWAVSLEKIQSLPDYGPQDYLIETRDMAPIMVDVEKAADAGQVNALAMSVLWNGHYFHEGSVEPYMKAAFKRLCQLKSSDKYGRALNGRFYETMNKIDKVLQATPEACKPLGYTVTEGPNMEI